MPILVGNITKDQEMQYGELLAPYLVEEGTVCIASSDFCHWLANPTTSYSRTYSFTTYYTGASASSIPSTTLGRTVLSPKVMM